MTNQPALISITMIASDQIFLLHRNCRRSWPNPLCSKPSLQMWTMLRGLPKVFDGSRKIDRRFDKERIESQSRGRVEWLNNKVGCLKKPNNGSRYSRRKLPPQDHVWQGETRETERVLCSACVSLSCDAAKGRMGGCLWIFICICAVYYIAIAAQFLHAKKEGMYLCICVCICKTLPWDCAGLPCNTTLVLNKGRDLPSQQLEGVRALSGDERHKGNSF